MEWSNLQTGCYEDGSYDDCGELQIPQDYKVHTGFTLLFRIWLWINCSIHSTIAILLTFSLNKNIYRYDHKYQ